MARLARRDVMTPSFDDFPICMQASGGKLEAAVYKITRIETNILVSLLLYNCIQVQRVGPRLGPPWNIAGRCLLFFEKAEGEMKIL